jgi:desumoylating isopeptidase 1
MEPVTVLLYDLSQGMAKTMSLGLIGKQLDGIWHTSVVVYGKEYCFGQGIEEMIPGNAPYGHPVQRFDMGFTEIPKEVFLDYMNTLRTVWTAEKYHLFDNNCNSFSNEVCNFLVGKDIPSFITGLPAEFLNTPMGQMLKPLLEGMYSRSSQSNQTHTNSLASTIIQNVTSLSKLEGIIRTNKCVVVDFTSKSCPPCRVISPEFEALVEEKVKSGNALVGVSVETTVARDIAIKYQITATPTFHFYLDGKKVILS